MRAIFTIGVVAFTLSAGIVSAEARAGRGFGGLGRSYVPVRTYMTPRGTYVAPHVSTTAVGVPSNNLTYPVGTSIRNASAGAVGVVGTAAVSRLPTDDSLTVDQPGSIQIISQAKPERKWCPQPGKLSGAGVGFCVLN